MVVDKSGSYSRYLTTQAGMLNRGAQTVGFTRHLLELRVLLIICGDFNY